MVPGGSGQCPAFAFHPSRGQALYSQGRWLSVEPRTSQPTTCARKTAPIELEIFSGGWAGYAPPAFRVGSSRSSLGSIEIVPPTVLTGWEVAQIFKATSIVPCRCDSSAKTDGSGLKLPPVASLHTHNQSVVRTIPAEARAEVLHGVENLSGVRRMRARRRAVALVLTRPYIDLRAPSLHPDNANTNLDIHCGKLAKLWLAFTKRRRSSS